MESKLTPEQLVTALEESLKRLGAFPGIMMGYAIGLSAIDEQHRAELAAALQHHSALEGCPKGFNPSQYEAINVYYDELYRYLCSEGIILNPNQPITSIVGAIQVLRLF